MPHPISHVVYQEHVYRLQVQDNPIIYYQQDVYDNKQNIIFITTYRWQVGLSVCLQIWIDC